MTSPKRRRWQDQGEPELTPAAITDAWSAWSRGELTFAEYLRRAMAVSQALAELDAADPEAELG